MRWFPGTRILTWVDDTWLSHEGYQAPRSAGWPAEPAATEQVEVQMGNAVAGVRADVQHEARAAFGKAVGSRDLPGDVEHLREQLPRGRQ